MDIQQRIADIMRGKVVLLKHETMEDLAGVLMSELGLAKSIGGQWVCFKVPYEAHDDA